jgi:hypothetical protein
MRKTKKNVERDEDDLPTFQTGEEFDALSAADKEKVWNYYNRVIPKSELRDPTPQEAALIEKQRLHNRKVGRPKIGRGTKMVAVTIEKGLLKRADAYAKRHGIKRARMIAQGLELVMDHGDNGNLRSAAREAIKDFERGDFAVWDVNEIKAAGRMLLSASRRKSGSLKSR